jgi:dethiobiotin synthetase
LLRDRTRFVLGLGMAKRGILFVTGTDTGVGKTVATCLLTRALRASGVRVAALKPLCSGSRRDAKRLRSAAGGLLTLDEVNPWWFQAPLTPWVAARQEGRQVRLPALLQHVRALRHRSDWILMEGAGGLLSPLGERFDARDLIIRLRARVMLVAVNRLGVINQVLLTLRALPPGSAEDARLILMDSSRPDASSESNAAVLGERLGVRQIVLCPRMTASEMSCDGTARPEMRPLVEWLMQA